MTIHSQLIPRQSTFRLSRAATGSGFLLINEQRVAAAIDETFAFFADATNLQALTPRFLEFGFVTPRPIEMRAGALIEYRLKLMGIPIGWLTRIDEWRPNRSFTDVQLRGPYARWIHRHTFTSTPEGTLVRDEVDYELPLAPLSHPAHGLFVRPQLARIFAFRREAIARLLG